MDVRRKVELLINLATSVDHTPDPALAAAREHENNAAAVMACRLIREHGLLDERQHFDHTRRPPPPPSPRQARKSTRTHAPPQQPKRDVSSQDNKSHKIKSRFDGLCRNCGEPFQIGCAVAWRRGIGAVIAEHVNCVKWLESQEVADG